MSIKPRIVVADDNAHMRRYMERLLGEKHEVVTVGDGEAALAAVMDNPPDLVVADVMMPRMDGLSLLARLRADQRTHRIPIILLSAHVGRESSIEGLEGGANDYLPKPFNARALLASVAARLEISRLSQQAIESEHELRVLAEAGEKRSLEQGKRAHERLEEYEKAMENLDEQIVVVDREYRYRVANRVFLAYLGLKREELEGAFVSDLLDKEVWELVTKKKFDEAFAGKVVKYELRYNYAFKGDRDLSIAYFPIEGPGGVIDRVACVLKDITKQKRAEEELRRSEAYLAQSERLSHTGSWALNVATGELFWSEEHFRILGLDPGVGILPYPLATKVIHPDDRPRVVAALDRAIREETEFETECRVVRPDGTIRFIRSLAQPVFNKTGQVVEYVGTIIDRTEQVRAEEELRRSEAHLAEAQRIGHIGSFIWNATTGECLWSKEHFRMVGMDADTFKPTRHNTKELIHPDDLPLMEQTLTKAIREKSDYEMEYRIMRADGVRYHRCIGRPVAKSNGDLQFTGVVVDLTERKQTEQALQEAQGELAHVSRMTAMGEIAAAIAHEINQPLGAIVNNSSYCLQLLARPEAETKKRAALEDIANDANRASAIIERIRGITKGSVREITKLRLKELIGDVLTLTQRLLEENHIQLRTSAPDDLPEISADPVQLQQVLFNLVVNAIEAMRSMRKDKRVLTIEAAHSVFEDSAAILITVADTGRGFESAAADRMFDAFYTTKPGGMGMGLRISRSIIEGYGGKLSARCNKGRGATFSCVLPV
jgi:PAS domain S-box-containing protein